MGGYDTKQVASRIRHLVQVEDGGDRDAAARRLGIPRLVLDSLLDGTTEITDLGLLASVIRGYRVDATWLLTGESDVTSSHLAPESRLQYADLLSQLGREILSRRQRYLDEDSGEYRAIA